jgi:hypothetical protein
LGAVVKKRLKVLEGVGQPVPAPSLTNQEQQSHGKV